MSGSEVSVYDFSPSVESKDAEDNESDPNRVP